MKTDINGTSTCAGGQENCGTFSRTIRVKGKKKSKQYFQYDYRTPSGKLFTCVKPTLEKCRTARDAWLKELEVTQAQEKN